jgi:hypothetical protein
MREDTVTKQNAKMAMASAATKRIRSPVCDPMMPGTNVTSAMMTVIPISTTLSGRSRSVRSTPTLSSFALVRNWRTPIRSDCAMVGIDLITVMIPAAATAPAPMMRMYPSQMRPGESSPMVVTAGSRPLLRR